MDKNPNLLLTIFEQLTDTFSQKGMRLDVERFKEYLQYTHETGEDISYEEFINAPVSNVIARRLAGAIGNDTVNKVVDAGLKALPALVSGSPFGKRRKR